jgi:hypothetical protein
MQPLIRTGGDNIYVAVKEQWRSLTTARETGHEIRALRVTRQQSGVDAALFEHSGDELEAGALVARWVRRVEPDEVLQKLDGISNRSVGAGFETPATVAVRLTLSHQGDDRGWQ